MADEIETIFIVVEQPGPDVQRSVDLKMMKLPGLNGGYFHAAFTKVHAASEYIIQAKKESGDKRNNFYVFELELKENKK